MIMDRKCFVTLAWCLLCLLHHAKSFTARQGVHQSILLRSQRLRKQLWAQSEDDEISLEAFQSRKRKLDEDSKQRDSDPPSDFDGYAMRDVILEKWGKCYDVDFNRVDSFGFKSLYLNILPFHLGARRFRHATELDYLCHLQAVVEILVKYKQLDYVLSQIAETKKKPRGGTSPLVAVPLRLDLSRDQVEEILGY